MLKNQFPPFLKLLDNEWIVKQIARGRRTLPRGHLPMQTLFGGEQIFKSGQHKKINNSFK